MDYKELYNSLIGYYNIINRDKPTIEAPIKYANENISEEDIINATKDFNDKNINWLDAALSRGIAGYENQWDPHASMYNQLGNDLKDFYQTNQPRTPTDAGKNFGGGYDFAQRMMDKLSQDEINNAGKAYQFSDMTAKTLLSPNISEKLYNQRQHDAIMDYIENKAGVDAAFRDSIWQGIPFKLSDKRSPEEITNMSIDYAEKSMKPRKGLLNKK